MAAAAAEQQRSAQESELSFIAQVMQARSAQVAASEAAKAANLQAQAAEAAAHLAKQGLSTAHAMLQESKAKVYTEQQRYDGFQVLCKSLQCSLHSRLCAGLLQHAFDHLTFLRCHAGGI